MERAGASAWVSRPGARGAGATAGAAGRGPTSTSIRTVPSGSCLPRSRWVSTWLGWSTSSRRCLPRPECARARGVGVRQRALSFKPPETVPWAPRTPARPAGGARLGARAAALESHAYAAQRHALVNGRRMELEARHGTVVARARRLNLAVPSCEAINAILQPWARRNA